MISAVSPIQVLITHIFFLATWGNYAYFIYRGVLVLFVFCTGIAVECRRRRSRSLESLHPSLFTTSRKAP